MKKTIFIIALAAAIAACNNSNNNDQKAPAESEATKQVAGTASSSSELYEKEWKLLELNGKAVVLDSTFPKYPYLTFQKENRISGNLGCNGFGGNIAFEAGNSIKISGITSTQMACPNLGVEQSFLDALNNAKSYTVENNILTFSNDKKAITAKLEATAK